MRFVVAIGWACFALSSRALPAHQSEFDRLYAAYAAGDRTVVITQLNSMAACTAIRPTLVSSTQALLARPAGPPAWQRDKAAFVLELANDLSKCAPKEFWVLLSEGRGYVIARPTLLGANPEEDAFELKWHLIAVAILHRESATDAADVYLDTLERRYGTSLAAKDAHSTLDPRFELMRAITAEQRGYAGGGAFATTVLVPRAATVDLSQQGTSPTTYGATYTSAAAGRPAYLAAAAKVLERTAKIEPIAPESYVRLAAVKLRLGLIDEAKAAIDRAVVPETDRALVYWAGLWRGRILDLLDRPAEAERAFQDALNVWPTGQAAAVGVALMRFKQNHRAEAAAAAAQASTMAPGAMDAWWMYPNGDGRFIAAWLADLRKALG